MCVVSTAVFSKLVRLFWNWAYWLCHFAQFRI